MPVNSQHAESCRFWPAAPADSFSPEQASPIPPRHTIHNNNSSAGPFNEKKSGLNCNSFPEVLESQLTLQNLQRATTSRWEIPKGRGAVQGGG